MVGKPKNRDRSNAAFDLRVHGFPLDQINAKEKMLALDVIAKL
jgi:hypothetical protein